ncbi:MAG: hypothetical protein P0111_04615 [Nitrospira sp.]|nr:hypothetical protein [Nitrospira sp.]
MAGYWWECEGCAERFEFPEVTGAASMGSFVSDKLMPSDWDQSLLAPICGKCRRATLRVTYEFPREDKLILRVIHIVWLQYDDYVPIMWETHLKDSPTERCFDFKYQRGRNPWGLNKAAVLSRQDLHTLFERYRQKTGVNDFP